MNKIGDRIKQKRKELGLTQAELGERLNITDRAVSKWEQGEGDPNLSIIPDIAKVLGVSLDYLLLGKEEPTITLDDMDAEKRLSLLIKKDDVNNFKKYKYQESEYVFGKSSGHLKDSSTKTWLEIINAGAKKIFGVCCNKLIKMNSKKVWAAFLVYDFIDEFVKMVVDCDRPDVLETIGFRIFAVGDKPAKEKGMPFAYSQNSEHYINNVDTYFIKQETLEYIFKSRQTSPKCFDYATTFEFQIVSSDGYNQRKEYTYTHLHNNIVEMAIKYEMYDVLDKVINFYKEELYNEQLPDGAWGSYDIRWTNTYVTGTDMIGQINIYGRVLYFRECDINSLLEKGNLEYAKKLNDYNGEVITRVKSLHYGNTNEISKVAHLSDSEMDRILKLHSNLSEVERIKLECVNNYILIPNKVRELRDLKLAREIIDNAYWHYYEFVYDCLTNGKQKLLLKFFIDNNLDWKAEKLIQGESEYSDLLSECWDLFNSKKNDSVHERVLGLSNKINDKYGVISFGEERIDVESEKGNLHNNKLIALFKHYKEELYEDVKRVVEADEQAKQDAIDRAKIVKGLDKEYFEGLLDKKGSLSKKDQRLFILDLCSLLDAIFKFDYKCEGEDFYERMTCFFNRMSENAPKSRDMDDGWGYMILDQDYENEVVIPEKKRIEHLTDIFNRLRIQRNNIAHSESKKVNELNEEELRECLEFVFSINKEVK